MILQYIDKISESIISFFERFTSSGNWKIKITFISVILSLFFAFPSYDVYLKGEFARHWQGILIQIDNPLAQHDYTPLEHSACLAFRLTPAVIAYLLRLNEFGCLIFQFVALVLMFYGVVLLAEKITKDRVASSFVSLAFAFIFAGNVLVSDLRGIFDVVAYCLMVLAMGSEKKFLIFLFTLLACYTDERAVVASGLIFLWFVLKEATLENFRFSKFI